jgi:hypothetical protein
MAKTKNTTKGQSIRMGSVEAKNRRDAQELRRLRYQQRRIVDLSRALSRATRAADKARLDAARELCTDTGWGVFGIVEWAAREREIRQLRYQLGVCLEERTAREEAAAVVGD